MRCRRFNCQFNLPALYAVWLHPCTLAFPVPAAGLPYSAPKHASDGWIWTSCPTCLTQHTFAFLWDGTVCGWIIIPDVPTLLPSDSQTFCQMVIAACFGDYRIGRFVALLPLVQTVADVPTYTPNSNTCPTPLTHWFGATPWLPFWWFLPLPCCGLPATATPKRPTYLYHALCCALLPCLLLSYAPPFPACLWEFLLLLLCAAYRALLLCVTRAPVHTAIPCMPDCVPSPPCAG